MLSVVLVLVIAGVLLYCLGMIPMDAAIMTLIRVVVILACVFYIIKALGLRIPGL
jgi:hypothetical protein